MVCFDMAGLLTGVWELCEPHQPAGTSESCEWSTAWCSRPAVSIKHGKPQRKLNFLESSWNHFFSCRTHKLHPLKLLCVLGGGLLSPLDGALHLQNEGLLVHSRLLFEPSSAVPASALAAPRCPNTSSDPRAWVTSGFLRRTHGFWVLSITSLGRAPQYPWGRRVGEQGGSSSSAPSSLRRVLCFGNGLLTALLWRN